MPQTEEDWKQREQSKYEETRRGTNGMKYGRDGLDSMAAKIKKKQDAEPVEW